MPGLLQQRLRLVGIVFDDRQRVIVPRKVRVQILGGRDSGTMQDGIDKLSAVDCVVDGFADTDVLEAVLREIEVYEVCPQRIVLMELFSDGGIVLVLLEQ